jgi:hypothetical protein
MYFGDRVAEKSKITLGMFATGFSILHDVEGH